MELLYLLMENGRALVHKTQKSIYGNYGAVKTFL